MSVRLPLERKRRVPVCTALLDGRGMGGVTCPCTAMLPALGGGGFGGGGDIQWATMGNEATMGANSPALVECHDGTILLAFVAGEAGKPGSASIAVSRLSRGDTRWTQPAVVSQDAALAMGHPVLVHDPSTKRVHLFHDATPVASALFDAQPSAQPNVRRVLSSSSSDCGKRWVRRKSRSCASRVRVSLRTPTDTTPD